jgi:hypothetical protein
MKISKTDLAILCILILADSVFVGLAISAIINSDQLSELASDQDGAAFASGSAIISAIFFVVITIAWVIKIVSRHKTQSVCQICGTPLVLVTEYNRCYCPKCKAYF